jgi:hypothetical protein
MIYPEVLMNRNFPSIFPKRPGPFGFFGRSPEFERRGMERLGIGGERALGGLTLSREKFPIQEC